MKSGMKQITNKLLIIATLIAGGTTFAVAHHSYSAFDMTGQRTVNGTIKTFDWTNPRT
jgi:hypothetical protein